MTFVAPNLACGEARGGSIPRQWGCDRRATKPQAKFGATRRAAGLFAQTSLLAPHRSTVGYARRSRLVWAKNPLPRTPSYLCLRPLRCLRDFWLMSSGRARTEFVLDCERLSSRNAVTAHFTAHFGLFGDLPPLAVVVHQ